MTMIRQYLPHPAGHTVSGASNLPASLLSYLMCQHPAAVTSIFNRGKEEMHVLTDPAVECVTIFTKVFRPWICDHIRIREPESC